MWGLKTIEYLFQKIRILYKIRNLEIAEAGIENEMVYVSLKDGLRFYGKASGNKEKKFYRILPRTFKNKVSFPCFKVTQDIVIRYFEGGLKLGGPQKEWLYKAKTGDVIAEMGAYMGYYTMHLARKVGKGGAVIAIEPMPENLHYLKNNVEYNNLQQVQIIESGVWNEKKTMVFYQQMHDKQSASLVLKGGDKNSFSIRVNTLDNILRDCGIKNVDLMIIQLNGTEPEALEGLTTLKPKNLSIAARYKMPKSENPAYKISNLLKMRNYKVIIKNNYYIFGSLK